MKNGHGLADVLPCAWAESFRFLVVVCDVVFLSFLVEGASYVGFSALHVYGDIISV